MTTSDWPNLGKSYDLYGNGGGYQKAEDMFGGLLARDSSRLYVSQNVRRTKMPDQEVSLRARRRRPARRGRGGVAMQPAPAPRPARRSKLGIDGSEPAQGVKRVEGPPLWLLAPNGRRGATRAVVF